MTNPPHALPKDVMKRFRDEYISTIPEKLKRIQELIEEMHQTVQAQTLQALRLHVHKIAGSSGTYGFPEVSILCKQFESEILQKMEELKKSKGDPRWAADFILYLEKITKGFSDA